VRTLQDIDAVVTESHEQSAGRRGTVRVAALPSFAASLLPDVILVCRKQNPNLGFVVRDAIASRVIQLVRSEEVDMDEHAQAMTLSERADALEEHMMHELEHIVIKSALFNLADGKLADDTMALLARNPGKYLLMGEDPRLPKMPAKPTLIDYFKCRFASTSHLLQSALLAKRAGHGEKVILACLLHDIAVASFIRCDHGYWGAQMIEPYVDEEVSWAVRTHQALRFFADESVGYQYPEAYVKWFGPDFRPEPYIVDEYKRARNHKYYMTARLITLHDLYSFEPDAKVDLEDFTDIIGRHFRQPAEGLGLDNSPSAHMWRTMLWPTRFL